MRIFRTVLLGLALAVLLAGQQTQGSLTVVLLRCCRTIEPVAKIAPGVPVDGVMLSVMTANEATEAFRVTLGYKLPSGEIKTVIRLFPRWRLTYSAWTSEAFLIGDASIISLVVQELRAEPEVGFEIKQ